MKNPAQISLENSNVSRLITGRETVAGEQNPARYGKGYFKRQFTRANGDVMKRVRYGMEDRHDGDFVYVCGPEISRKGRKRLAQRINFESRWKI